MTLTCDQCREHLIDYHYRETNGTTSRAVASHLSSCTSCAVEYCRLDADLGGIATLLEDEPGPRVLANLEREVRHAARPKRRLFDLLQLRVPIYQPMAVLLATGAMWFFFTHLALPDETDSTPSPSSAAEIRDYDARTLISIQANVL